jgi:predicted nucleic acid-binding protein
MGPVKRNAVVYLDTNVLIYMTEGEAAQRAVLRQRFKEYAAAQARLITSDLAFTEVLVRPIRDDNQELLRAYERLMTQFVEPQPIAREVLYLAAKLRAETPNQRTPDAIHVATAILAGAHIFVTGDKGIKNLPTGMALALL